MKTSKIKEVTSVKPHTNAHGTTQYHCLVMENGDKINIGKKSIQQVGWELTYELTGGDDGQQEFKKAKAAQKMDTPTNGVQQSNPTKDKSIIAQVALKCACNVLQQSQAGHDSNVVTKMAEDFNTWLLNKSGIQC